MPRTIPGFGHSDAPDAKSFAYTFDKIASVTEHFADALGLSKYTLYMQDYGGPVGFRMALAHPERVEALIVQDAVAHNEGLEGELGDATGILGGSACVGRSLAQKPAVAGHHQDAPCGKRS